MSGSMQSGGFRVSDSCGSAPIQQQKTIRVFTTPVCPHCQHAKAYLEHEWYAFQEIDIMADRQGLRQMIMATGQHGVPVVMVGDRAMVGWDRDEFEALMALETKHRRSNNPI